MYHVLIPNTTGEALDWTGNSLEVIDPECISFQEWWYWPKWVARLLIPHPGAAHKQIYYKFSGGTLNRRIDSGHWAPRRLITRSREIAEPRNMVWEWSHRSSNLAVLLPRRFSNSRTIRQLSTHIWRLRDFASSGLTPNLLVNKGHVSRSERIGVISRHIVGIP